MQKISKWVQNYSKYHSMIFAGKYEKFAGNFRHCRQSFFAGKLPAKPMSRYTVENVVIFSASFKVVRLALVHGNTF